MDGAAPTAELAVDGIGLDGLVEGCAAAHQRLLGLLGPGDDIDNVDVMDDIDDAWIASASRLAGWTRGHVLAHLTGNADSFSRLFEAAARGEVGEQYPGGAPARDEAIAHAARMPAGDLVGALRRSIWRLESHWARADASTWSSTGRLLSGATVSMPETVFRRWRETVVHTFDLDAGIGWDEWPAAWVRVELNRQKMAWTATRPMGLGTMPPAALALDDRHRLAWLIGRASPTGLPAGPGL